MAMIHSGNIPPSSGGGGGGGGASSEELRDALHFDTALGEMVTPHAVGGIAQGVSAESLNGMTMDELISKLLFPEVNPTIVAPSAITVFTSGFTNGTTYEVGKTLPKLANLGYTFNRGSIKASGVADKYRAGEATGATYSVSGQSSVIPTEDTPSEVGTYTYKAVVSFGEGDTALTSYKNEATKDANGNNLTNPLPSGSVNASTISIHFKHYAYLGTSSKQIGFTSADIIALGTQSNGNTNQKHFATSNAWGSASSKLSVTANDGEYIYYACPKSFGTPTWSDGAGTYSFEKVDEIEFTNAQGKTTTFVVWRASATAGLGTQAMFIY